MRHCDSVKRDKHKEFSTFLRKNRFEQIIDRFYNMKLKKTMYLVYTIMRLTQPL